jgi:hypothetical protein
MPANQGERVKMLKLLKTIATAGDSGDSRFLGVVFVLAFFTGGCRAVIGRNERTRWYDIVAAAIISAISGLSVGAVCLYYLGAERRYLIMAICSVSGWCGVALMDVAGSVAMKIVRHRADSLWPPEQ